VLETVTDWEDVVPTVTVPKLIDAGATEIAGDVWEFVDDFPATPTQPDAARVAARAIGRARNRTHLAHCRPAAKVRPHQARLPKLGLILITYSILSHGEGQKLLTGRTT